MRSQPRKCTATKALMLAALLLAGGSAWAASTASATSAVGTVTRLSGPLLVKKADGTMKILSVKSEVEQGDTLVSEKNTYAQIRFVDNGEMTVRPDTTLIIENYSFDPAKPEGDRATFNLLKGGVRSTTGLLGKRNHERFALRTPDGTIGVHGTTFIAQYVPPPTGGGILLPRDGTSGGIPSGSASLNKLPAPGDIGRSTTVPLPENDLTQEQIWKNSVDQLVAIALESKSPPTRDAGAPPTVPLAPPGSDNASVGKNPVSTTPPVASPTAPPPLAPGLHLQVTDGAIVVTNSGGSLGFQAGQFGYVPSVNQPPVIVPSNPNIQFVPPPSFNSTPFGPATGTSSSGQGQATDCIVR